MKHTNNSDFVHWLNITSYTAVINNAYNEPANKY